MFYEIYLKHQNMFTHKIAKFSSHLFLSNTNTLIEDEEELEGKIVDCVNTITYFQWPC